MEKMSGAAKGTIHNRKKFKDMLKRLGPGLGL